MAFIMLRKRLVNDERRPPIGDDIGRNMDMNDDGLVITIEDQLVGKVIHDEEDGDEGEDGAACANAWSRA